jgi:hypothetical protein
MDTINELDLDFVVLPESRLGLHLEDLINHDLV